MQFFASVRTNLHSLDFDNQPLHCPAPEPSQQPIEVRARVAAFSAITGRVPAHAQPLDQGPDQYRAG